MLKLVFRSSRRPWSPGIHAPRVVAPGAPERLREYLRQSLLMLQAPRRGRVVERHIQAFQARRAQRLDGFQTQDKTFRRDQRR